MYKIQVKYSFSRSWENSAGRLNGEQTTFNCQTGALLQIARWMRAEIESSWDDSCPPMAYRVVKVLADGSEVVVG